MTLKGSRLPEPGTPNERELDERLQAMTEQTDVGALTDSTGGTVDGTLAAISGSGDDTNINNNFADLADKVNKLRDALRNAGIMV